jgi:hypothetical protein
LDPIQIAFHFLISALSIDFDKLTIKYKSSAPVIDQLERFNPEVFGFSVQLKTMLGLRGSEKPKIVRRRRHQIDFGSHLLKVVWTCPHRKNTIGCAIFGLFEFMPNVF